MDPSKMKPGQRVVVTLRKMIASGELKAGERIAEIPTAEALGVSRMPVRTALRALEQEGLVVKLGARGYAPRLVASEQIRAAIEVRGVLEGFAARRAAELGLDLDAEAALEACLAVGEALFATGRLVAGDHDRYHAYNLTFHNILVSASLNPALEEALTRNNYKPFAAATALALDLDDLPAEFDHLSAAHRQHQAVFAAIRRGDGQAAETIMRDHAFAAVRNARIFERLNDQARPAFAARAVRSD
jgi:GntR family transcriptional regulator of vanillate catabolism